jgi:predicted RNA-binding protein associated with RNAse of E/G family
MMWAAGDAVVLRELHGGRLWSVRPATVVRDAPDLIALYLAPGAPWLRAWGPDGRKKRLPVGEWRLVDIGWPWSCLRLHTPGTHHDVLVFWSADHAQLRGWYVNLQTPLRQTPLGFDYTDEFLDAIVEPDRSAWRWEDEDDLADALRLGLVTAERARFLRAEGERAVELLRARRPPYREAWEQWRPDPAWPVPRLPDGWDAV